MIEKKFRGIGFGGQKLWNSVFLKDFPPWTNLGLEYFGPKILNNMIARYIYTSVRTFLVKIFVGSLLVSQGKTKS